ncbi:MAG: hypothetical protein KF811_04350 [Dokdonella sp.]|nr:hypothetical protein [Dokdonella sp.]
MPGEAAQAAMAQVQKVIDVQASALQKDFQVALESFSARGFSAPNGPLANSFKEKTTERLRLAGRSVYTTLQASALFSSLIPEEVEIVRNAAEEGLRTIAESYHGAMEQYRLESARGREVDALLDSEIMKLAELFKHR